MNDPYSITDDPRQRVLESLGRTGKKLAGNSVQMGVTAARAMQNALFPDEFEYYALTLEIVTSKGQSVEWLTFPVMPESIMYDDASVVNIQKTAGGISASDNNTYTPKTISIQGTFGKKFRLLLNPKEIIRTNGTNAVDITNSYSDQVMRKPEFDSKIKSGYGTVKILQRIMELSSQIDDENQPYRMYLYLPPLGQNFLVKRTSFQLSQDNSSSNMMWRYSIQLTAIAPLELLLTQDQLQYSLQSTLKVDVLQRSANMAANTITDSLRQLFGTRRGNQ